MARASTNLIHRFESKLEAQNAKLDAHLEALDRKLRVLQWIVGIGLIAAAGAVIAVIQALP